MGLRLSQASPHALQGRFDPDNFNQAVVDVAQKLVPLTVTLWNKVSAKMLPTPAKFHYLFNMRELSKVHAVLIVAIIHPTDFLSCFVVHNNSQSTAAVE